MKSSGYILKLLLAAFILGVGHLLVSLRGALGGDKAGRDSLVPAADGADFIELVRAGNPQPIVLTNNGAWRIERPVRADADSSCVAALADALAFGEIVDTLADGEMLKLGMTRDDFDLNEPRIKVTVGAAGKKREVRFGRATPSGDGVYAATGDDPVVFVVPARVFETADVQLGRLRRKNLFNLVPEEVVVVDLRFEAGRFFRIECGPKRDKMREFLSTLLGAEAREFVWPSGSGDEPRMAGVALLAGYGLDPENSVVVTVRGIDGADRTVGFGKDAGEGLVYATAFGDTAIVKVDSSIRDAVVAMGAAQEDPRLIQMEAAEISTLTLSFGQSEFLLGKAADGSWRLESPVAGAADGKLVDEIVGRVVALRAEDLDERGIVVSVSSNQAPVRVAAKAVMGDSRPEDLRGLDILSVKAGEIKRLSGGGDLVVYNPERKVWMVENAIASRRPDEENIAKVVALLEKLEAVRVEKLPASEDDLKRYGLDEPAYRLSIDVTTAGVARKNLLVGAKGPDGVYITLGASDAVFTISREQADTLTGSLTE